MGDWASYWRSADQPLEVMHAHFEAHTYAPHSHDAYSFGVTEMGAQAFTCRGEQRTSVAGMVMAFNPDDPHDGHAATEDGFTYRIVHIGPSLVGDLLTELTGSPTLPLFADPVLHDPVLAQALLRFHRVASGGGSTLARDEALAGAVAAMVGRGARSTPTIRAVDGGQHLAALVRSALQDRYLEDLSAATLASLTGTSRFAVYRAFRAAYGMSPSGYQRLLRLRAARNLLADGVAPAEAASLSGFADQAHLTRWFRRCYGITPGTYRSAG
ncbi:AraC family transcriptional regulator [Labedaea rhizosphaerae]|nr:AraC family transcriptional regulator [Labedaea rhizosphaerae]